MVFKEPQLPLQGRPQQNAFFNRELRQDRFLGQINEQAVLVQQVLDRAVEGAAKRGGRRDAPRFADLKDQIDDEPTDPLVVAERRVLGPLPPQVLATRI